MMIRWKADAENEGRGRVAAALHAAGARFVEIDGGLVVLNGNFRFMSGLACDPAVEAIAALDAPYKLAARAVRPRGTIVRVGDVAIGGEEIVVIAGPCSVEDEAQIDETAFAVARSGAQMLRGGAFKPRTSPYAFQGLGARGLELLASAGKKAGLPTVTEVVSPSDVPLVAAHADVLQVGARNAQNYPLLEALGRTLKPVLLKRGPSMTLEELLLAAEYVLAGGNPNVILCERGIRTHDRATRNVLDLGGAAALKRATHLPVILDPSHGTGRRELVVPLARAAIAAGADGVMLEVHPRPDESWSDADQALGLDAFDAFMRTLPIEASIHGRALARPRARSDGDLVRAARGRIDAIDEALQRLLAQRLELALEIGKAKHRAGLPAHVPEREADVMRRAAAGDSQAIVRVFETIVCEMREAQLQVLHD